jgi:mono/diheme cytochrome c family protein
MDQIMMFFSKAGLASIALVTGSFLVPTLAPSAEHALGEQIAARECAGCHGISAAKGVTIQDVYVPSFFEIANRPSQSRESLMSILTIPRHPGESHALGNRELRQLAEYILSLRD